MLLITGAAGTLGKEICRLLFLKNIPFRAGIHTPNGTEAVKQYTSDIVSLDYHKPGTIEKAVRGINTMLFIMPPSSRMTDMARKVLYGIKNSKVSHIVKVSAYGEKRSLSQLGSWHRQADTLIVESGISYTLLCCLPFMQNILYLAERMIKPLNGIFLPCGEGKISYIDMRDVARVACTVIQEPETHVNKAYVLTGKEALSYREIAGILSRLTGRAIIYRDISESDTREKMKNMGISSELIEAKLVSFRLEKQNLRACVSPHVREITGKEPVSFEEFVKDHIRCFTGDNNDM